MQRSGTFNQKSGGIRVLIFPLILAMGFTFGKLAIGASGTDVFAPLTSDMGYGELFHSSKNNNARFNLGLSYVYTADPVEIQGNAGDEEGDFENNLHGLHLGLSLRAHKQIALLVQVPFYYTTSETDFAVQDGEFNVGDIKVSLQGTIIDNSEENGFGLGVVPFVEIPVSDNMDYPLTAGDELRFGGLVALDGNIGSTKLVANVGYKRDSGTEDDFVLFGAGVEQAIDEEGLHVLWLHVNGLKNLDPDIDGIPLEARLGFSANFANTHTLNVGVGRFITSENLAPDLRAFLGYNLAFGELGAKAVEEVVEEEPVVEEKVEEKVEEPVAVETRKIRVGKIYFALGQAGIKDSSYGALDTVVSTLTENPEIKKVKVVGHTDSQGNPDYNRSLSKKRAQSVVDYLVAKGIAAERLESDGLGPDEPIDTNDTREGRARNRRVEFNILEAPANLEVETVQ